MRYKVMFVGGSFPMPMGGGSVNYVYRLLSEFNNIPFLVYTSSYAGNLNSNFDKGFGHKIVRSSYCKHVLGKYNENFPMRLFKYLIAITQISYYILKYRPQIVYFTEFSLMITSCFFSSLFHSFKLGLFTYSEEILQIKDKSVYRWFLPKVLRKCDVIITVCDYTRNLINEIVDVDNKIVKIVPSIPYTGVSPHKVKNDVGDQVKILTVGRLCERKGHIDVIDVINRLHKEYPNVSYDIIGIGEYERNIRDHIKHTNSEAYVTMKGKLSDEELNKAYGEADIFVMHHKKLNNGDTEGCPTVFLEASWHRLPVVGGEAGGVSDAIIDGVTGFICHIDTDELYDSIKKLIDNRELRCMMGENGYRYASSFTAYNQSCKFVEITNSLI